MHSNLCQESCVLKIKNYEFWKIQAHVYSYVNITIFLSIIISTIFDWMYSVSFKFPVLNLRRFLSPKYCFQPVRTRSRARKSWREQRFLDCSFVRREFRQRVWETEVVDISTRIVVVATLAETGSPALIFRSDVWWVNGRTVLDATAAAAATTSVASTTVDARRWDEIAPPPGETRCRDDELSAREICKSNRTGPAWSFVRLSQSGLPKWVFFYARVILERAAFPRAFLPAPRLYDPVN